MAEINSTHCCGLGIIDHIGSTRDWGAVIRAVKRTHPRRAHYVFSQAESRYDLRGEARKYGEEFMAFILKNKLGTVVKSRAITNPNSGNKLTVFTWTVSPTNLSRFK